MRQVGIALGCIIVGVFLILMSTANGRHDLAMTGMGSFLVVIGFVLFYHLVSKH